MELFRSKFDRHSFLARVHWTHSTYKIHCEIVYVDPFVGYAFVSMKWMTFLKLYNQFESTPSHIIFFFLKWRKKQSQHREFVKNFDSSSAPKAKLLLTIGDTFEVCDDVGMLIEILCQITDPLYLSINSLEFDRLHTACMEWAWIGTSTGNQLIKIKRVTRRNLHWYSFVCCFFLLFANLVESAAHSISSV